MATHDYEAIGKAVVLIASLFAGSAAAPQAEPAKTPAKTKAKDEPATSVAPETPSTPADTPSTPEPQKADGPPEGNSKGLSGPDFSKWGLAWAATCGDNGATAQTVFAGFQTADGGPVQRFSQVQEKDYDAFQAAAAQAGMA